MLKTLAFIRIDRIHIVWLILPIIIMLSGCNASATNADQSTAHINEKQAQQTSPENPLDSKLMENEYFLLKQMDQLKPLENIEVPVPEIMIANQRPTIVQDSYCWGGVCADYIGGPAMLKEKSVPQVEASTVGYVVYPYTAQPAEVYINQYKIEQGISASDKPNYNSYVDYKVIPIEATESLYTIQSQSVAVHQFQVPAEPGIYYYGIFARWLTEDGQHSQGDTSSVIGFEVTEKDERASSQ